MRWSRALHVVGGASAGAGCVVWALVDSAWRNAGGQLTAAVCFPISCGVGALIAAAFASTPYRAAAAWFAIALVGHAASLQLIIAGPLVRYQRYPPLDTLAATHPWLLAVIAGQAVLVSTGLARLAIRSRRAGSTRAGTGRLVAATLLTGAAAAAVSPDAGRYVGELAFAASLQALSVATLVVMALSLPRGTLAHTARRLDDVLGPIEDDRPGVSRRDHRWGWAAGAAAAAAAVALSVLSYERHPHIADEVSYLYQARYFATGALAMPPPPSPSAFDLDLMTYEPTRWFSPLSPGWPGLLALGVLIGAPWLINPVLAGLNVLLTYKLLRELYALRTARYATALLAVSPWFVFLGMSFMTHMATLTCALAAAHGVLRARRTAGGRWGLLAGSAIGAASLIRPLDGAIVALLVAGWALHPEYRPGVRARAGLVIGALGVGALVLPYNSALTGDAFTFPVNAYFDRQYHPDANAYGFGPQRGMGWPIDPNPGHSPVDGAINVNLNVFGINTDLFGWGTGSLLFIAFLLCGGGLNAPDRLMCAAILVVVGAYFFYYFSGGPDFGARYWFLAVVPLVALTARGIHAMERHAGPRVGVAVAALVAMALVNFIPWRAVDKYHRFRGMSPEIRRLAVESRFDRDLVFVRGTRFPDYASAAVENPLDLRDGTVYAWDRDAASRETVLRAYPDRRVWVVDGPSITGSGFRVARGPLTAASLMPATR